MNSEQKIVVLTGSTAGIGRAIAEELSNKGHHLILPVRNKAKGEKLKEELKKTNPQSKIDLFDCDLSSISQIKSFAETILEKYPQLDILINNAGIWDMERKESEDGIERMMAVNFIAPFLLSNLLTDRLAEKEPGRIVNVASALHKGPLDFNDFELKNGFSGYKGYSRSKLALILFSRLKAEREKEKGVKVNAVHPGLIQTELTRESGWFSKLFFRLFGKKPETGAVTPVYVALSENCQDISGEYFVDKNVKKGSPESRNMEVAQQLWDFVEKKYLTK